MKKNDPWKRRSEAQKARFFAQSVSIFYKVKAWIEKFEGGAGGVWLRPSVDTMYLRWEDMKLLRGWTGWEAASVRSVAVDEMNLPNEVVGGPRVWALLLYVFPRDSEGGMLTDE